MMGATDDEMRAQKARDRANRRPVGMGTVAAVSGSTATVSLGMSDVDAVIPSSVQGVAVGATVRVQMGNTPVVEAVLEAVATSATFTSTSPAGSGTLTRISAGLAAIRWETSSGVTLANSTTETTLLTLPSEWWPSMDWLLTAYAGTPARLSAGARLTAAGVLTVVNTCGTDARTVLTGIYPLAN